MAHELTDWHEEAERLRVERDALTARLAEREAEIAALRGEITRLRHGYRDVEDTMYLRGSDAAARRIDALLAAVPAPPTAAPLAAAEPKEGDERCRVKSRVGSSHDHWYVAHEVLTWTEKFQHRQIEYHSWTIARDASRAARGKASDAQ